MPAVLLPRHPGLFATTRLRRIATDAMSPAVRDWMLLALFGILAACSSAFLDLGIKKIPGHAIVRVVFPLALGLALVPRKGGGCVMGGTAAITGGIFQALQVRGEGTGFGALTSLIATGPLLDWTLRRAHGGWRQLLAFAVAGLTSNYLALAVKIAQKSLGWEHAGKQPFLTWFAWAAVTYTVCGLLAGLISGAVLFSVRPRPENSETSDRTP